MAALMLLLVSPKKLSASLFATPLQINPSFEKILKSRRQMALTDRSQLDQYQTVINVLPIFILKENPVMFSYLTFPSAPLRLGVRVAYDQKSFPAFRDTFQHAF
jgi:hypothetical protein